MDDYNNNNSCGLLAMCKPTVTLWSFNKHSHCILSLAFTSGAAC